MATITTYLLVSNPQDPETLCSHPILDEHELELQTRSEREETLPAIRFVAKGALEERPSLEKPCRELSAAFPEATITFCEVEERFGQVEHFQSIVFIDGKQAGEIEHGYVLNVGS